jgi:hypothetical protein
LVPFGDHLVAFQIRSKREEKLASQKTEIDFARISGRIEDACAQLKTIRRAIDAGQLKELVNARGVRLTLEPSTVKRITGVVVLDLIGEEHFPEDERTAIHGGYSFDHAMPIHIFTIDVFETLALELDTIPDFLAYLEAREALLSRGILIYAGNELDFLAIYRTKHDLVEDCMHGRLHSLFLDHGLWQQYRSQHANAIDRRAQANEASRLIDNVIENAWRCIGHDSGVRFQGRPDIGGPGTEESYYRTAFELSRLTRLDRRLLGQRYIEKAKRASGRGHSYWLLQTPWRTGVVILASNESRQRRCERLVALAGAAHAVFDLDPVVGVVTEAFPHSGASFDYVVAGGYSPGTKAELAKHGAKFFQAGKRVSLDEYPGAEGEGGVKAT